MYIITCTVALRGRAAKNSAVACGRGVYSVRVVCEVSTRGRDAGDVRWDCRSDLDLGV